MKCIISGRDRSGRSHGIIPGTGFVQPWRRWVAFCIVPSAIVKLSWFSWSHISNSLKNKIWEGKFIDLSPLVKTACELHDYEAQGDFEVKDGRLCIVKPKSNTYLNVSPGDFDLLGFRFQGKYYFEKILPFGSSISCAFFDKFATFLHWLTQKYSHNNFIIHYLDDFLFVVYHIHQTATTLSKFLGPFAPTLVSELPMKKQ